MNQIEVDELAKAFDRRMLRLNINQQGFNGSTKFVNTLLAILTLLVASAICGEVVVYGQVQGLQATVNYMAHEIERK